MKKVSLLLFLPLSSNAQVSFLLNKALHTIYENASATLDCGWKAYHYAFQKGETYLLTRDKRIRTIKRSTYGWPFLFINSAVMHAMVKENNEI